MKYSWELFTGGSFTDRPSATIEAVARSIVGMSKCYNVINIKTFFFTESNRKLTGRDNALETQLEVRASWTTTTKHVFVCVSPKHGGDIHIRQVPLKEDEIAAAIRRAIFVAEKVIEALEAVNGLEPTEEELAFRFFK